jgi:hypothetical protein
MRGISFGQALLQISLTLKLSYQSAGLRNVKLALSLRPGLPGARAFFSGLACQSRPPQYPRDKASTPLAPARPLLLPGWPALPLLHVGAVTATPE